MSVNPISHEPVVVQTGATVVAWLAARYGLKLSDEQATIVAGAVVVVLAPFVRQLVRPTVKDPMLLPLIEDGSEGEERTFPPEPDPPAGNAVRSNIPSHVKITGGFASGGVVTGGHPDPNGTVDTGALTRHLRSINTRLDEPARGLVSMGVPPPRSMPPATGQVVPLDYDG
jgi:hypothetical protein